MYELMSSVALTSRTLRQLAKLLLSKVLAFQLLKFAAVTGEQYGTGSGTFQPFARPDIRHKRTISATTHAEFVQSLLIRPPFDNKDHAIKSVLRKNKSIPDAALEGDFHPLHPLVAGDDLPSLAEHLVKDRCVVVGHRTRPALRSVDERTVGCAEDDAPYPSGDGVDNVQGRGVYGRGHQVLLHLLLLRHGLRRLLILLLVLWLHYVEMYDHTD